MLYSIMEDNLESMDMKLEIRVMILMRLLKISNDPISPELESLYMESLSIREKQFPPLKDEKPMFHDNGEEAPGTLAYLKALQDVADYLRKEYPELFRDKVLREKYP